MPRVRRRLQNSDSKIYSRVGSELSVDSDDLLSQENVEETRGGASGGQSRSPSTHTSVQKNPNSASHEVKDADPSTHTLVQKNPNSASHEVKDADPSKSDSVEMLKQQSKLSLTDKDYLDIYDDDEDILNPTPPRRSRSSKSKKRRSKTKVGDATTTPEVSTSDSPTSRGTSKLDSKSSDSPTSGAEKRASKHVSMRSSRADSQLSQGTAGSQSPVYDSIPKPPPGSRAQSPNNADSGTSTPRKSEDVKAQWTSSRSKPNSAANSTTGSGGTGRRSVPPSEYNSLASSKGTRTPGTSTPKRKRETGALIWGDITMKDFDATIRQRHRHTILQEILAKAARQNIPFEEAIGKLPKLDVMDRHRLPAVLQQIFEDTLKKVESKESDLGLSEEERKEKKNEELKSLLDKDMSAKMKKTFCFLMDYDLPRPANLRRQEYPNYKDKDDSPFKPPSKEFLFPAQNRKFPPMFEPEIPEDKFEKHQVTPRHILASEEGGVKDSMECKVAISMDDHMARWRLRPQTEKEKKALISSLGYLKANSKASKFPQDQDIKEADPLGHPLSTIVFHWAECAGNITEAHLKALAQKFGTVERVIMISSNVAYVTMQSILECCELVDIRRFAGPRGGKVYCFWLSKDFRHKAVVEETTHRGYRTTERHMIYQYDHDMYRMPNV